MVEGFTDNYPCFCALKPCAAITRWLRCGPDDLPRTDGEAEDLGERNCKEDSRNVWVCGCFKTGQLGVDGRVGC